eukprot:2826220-Heterocapsa_arctica.AAC.1
MGKYELHWLAQRDGQLLSPLALGLTSGLQDHRPDRLESGPRKGSAGRHESICRSKENNERTDDKGIRDYKSQLYFHRLAQTTGKRCPKYSKSVTHRGTKHGKGEGEDTCGNKKNEKLRLRKHERADEGAGQEQSDQEEASKSRGAQQHCERRSQHVGAVVGGPANCSGCSSRNDGRGRKNPRPQES